MEEEKTRTEVALQNCREKSENRREEKTEEMERTRQSTIDKDKTVVRTEDVQRLFASFHVVDHPHVPVLDRPMKGRIRNCYCGCSRAVGNLRRLMNERGVVCNEGRIKRERLARS